MTDIKAIKDYYKKLEKVLLFEADFSFFQKKLIKKNKIDDLFCCIIATLPDSYKKLMKQKEGRERTSVLCYELLFKAIKKKFALSQNVYFADTGKAINYIDKIIKTIETDIQYAEKNVR